MSSNDSTTDPLTIAARAEADLNSPALKGSTRNTSGQSDSTLESGVDSSVEQKFPGSTVTYGSAASGQGNNREIPESEGGGLNQKGQPTKASDFGGGVGGPEDKARKEAERRPGDDDVDERAALGRTGGPR